MLRLTNPIRRYDWGSTSAIPAVLGVAPDGEPQAELWIGAHPDSPSTLPDGRPLDAAVRDDAEALLGMDVQRVFGARLPYLTKILAAAAPLSLQVHPDAEQAAAGFAEEDARGVAPDARERRYRDPFHKPEMVLALEPFHALCGWRNPAASRGLLAALDVPHPRWAHLDGLLSAEDDAVALERTVAWLLGDDPDIPGLVTAAGDAAARAAGDASTAPVEIATAAALSRAHPGDPGVLVALLLNRVTLQRGEALYLPAGNVHAYLEGTAVEVMAASDNVLRAGLTSKHVDAAELLRIVDWTPRPVPAVTPTQEGVWRHYRPAAAEFAVAWADLGDADADDPGVDGWHPGPDSGPRVVLALDGTVQVRTARDTQALERGHAVLVPADDGPLAVRGEPSDLGGGRRSGTLRADLRTAVVVSVPPPPPPPTPTQAEGPAPGSADTSR